MKIWIHYFIQLFQSTASLDYFHISFSYFAFMPQWESEVVMTETVWPINPKIFTICPCTEKVCLPIFPLSIYHYVACNALYLFFSLLSVSTWCKLNGGSSFQHTACCYIPRTYNSMWHMRCSINTCKCLEMFAGWHVLTLYTHVY